jgi:hypothetical protein
MRFIAVNMSIADFCGSLDRKETVVDKRYQRSSEVWPSLARSYLVETILKGFPIPKLAIHQATDLRSRKTTKFIVDGQQRTMAIQAFYRGDLTLSRSLELEDAAGRTYLDLPEPLQELFLSYVLDFDQFEAATDEDVREYFRRINSFTAPLNPEEQRHARYQGHMKWFILGLGERHSDTLVSLDVIQSRGIVRMADTKFFAEIINALLTGIVTTNKTILDAMYAKFDKEEVDRSVEMSSALDEAIDVVLRWPDLRGTALMRTHVFYSLLLAIIALQRRWPRLAELVPKAPISRNANLGLLRLASAIEEPMANMDLKGFTDAAGGKTNVKAQREERVRWLGRALAGELNQ